MIKVLYKNCQNSRKKHNSRLIDENLALLGFQGAVKASQKA